MITPFVAGLGPTELLLILAVVVLLFGASKLPELARGSGRALRIFKAETKGLMDDDDDVTAQEPVTPSPKPTATPDPSALESRRAELDARQAELDAERERLRRDGTA